MVNLMVNEIKTIALHPAAKSADFIKQLIAQYVPDFRLNVILGQQDFEYIQLPDFKILIDVGGPSSSFKVTFFTVKKRLRGGTIPDNAVSEMRRVLRLGMKLNGAQNGDPTGVNPITKVLKYDFELNEIMLVGLILDFQELKLALQRTLVVYYDFNSLRMP